MSLASTEVIHHLIFYMSASLNISNIQRARNVFGITRKVMGHVQTVKIKLFLNRVIKCLTKLGKSGGREETEFIVVVHEREKL